MNTQNPTPPTFITKKCGPKFSPVWSHFTPCAKKAGGHYSGACNFCEFKISTATVSSLEEHLANVCMNVPEAIRLEYLKKRAGNIEEPVSVIATDKKRKLANEKQVKLNLFYESTYLTPERQSSIERTIVQAFICAGLPFRVIENPYIIELFHQLRPAFIPPSRETLAGKLVGNELSRVILKQQNAFQQFDNLTLGKCILFYILYFNYLFKKFIYLKKTNNS